MDYNLCNNQVLPCHFKPYIFFFHIPLSVRGRLQRSTIFKDRHHLHSHNSTNTCILASAHQLFFTIPFDDQIYIVSVDLLAKRRLSRKFYARSNFKKDKNRITSLILFQSPKFVRKSILPWAASLGVIQPLRPFPLNFHKQDLRPPLPNALHYNTRTKEIYQEMMCIC